MIGITRWSIGTLQLAAPSLGLPRLRAAHVMPFIEVARASARALRIPAVFVPEEFYGSATQWSLSLGVRVHAGTMRRRMGRYALPFGVRPGRSPAPHTQP